MGTQEFIQTVNPAAASWRVPPTISATNPTLICPIDGDTESVFAEKRCYLGASRSAHFRPHVRRHIACTRAPHRWGIVLAGSDGTRSREVGEWVRGDNRPEQFCPLLSDHTLLEETRYRAERSVPPDQILYSVIHAHRDYYLPTLADRPLQTVVQPSDRGTAPAIICALMRIAQSDPDAIVAIFPCDHYFSPESAFTAVVESAFQVAQQRSNSVVLLGVEPDSPEIDYGWIEIGGAIDGHSRLFRVDGFHEKPPLALARSLFKGGSLWNTFAMVGHVRAFFELARRTVPTMLQVLESRKVASLSEAEFRIPDSIYDQIAPTDFSRQILALAPDRLLALRLENLRWCGLEDPYRVLVTLLQKDGSLPGWVKLWPDPQPVARSARASA